MVNKSLLSVEEALKRVVTNVAVVSTEEVSITEAIGRVTANRIWSRRTQPPVSVSAMDGYAVRADDIKAATHQSPTVLKVVGMIAAGDVPHRTVESVTAIRIITGAPIPKMADAVVPFEDTDELERKSTT